VVETPNVYKLVGGNDYEHYLEDPQVYANACALRLIRAFNYGGMVIQKGLALINYVGVMARHILCAFRI